MAIYSRSPALRYASAVAVASMAVGLKFALGASIGQETPFLCVFTAILLSAWFGGRGPGIAATAICGMAIWFLWLPPFHSWKLGSYRTVIQLLAFVVEGTLISLVVSSIETARREARESRLKAEVLRDVSQQIGAKARLRAERRDALLALYQDDSGDARTMARSVARLNELLGTERAWLLEPSDDDLVLRPDRLMPGDPEVADVEVESEESAAVAYRSGQLVTTSGPEGAEICVAIPGGSRPRGVLVVRRDRRRSLDSEDQAFLVSAARALGDRIGRRRLDAAGR
jgi:K+-sensing histidine kinase KdpD